jgi:hypothetical protein
VYLFLLLLLLLLFQKYGICGTLLGSSANTDYCDQAEGDQQERYLEEQQQQQQQNNGQRRQEENEEDADQNNGYEQQQQQQEYSASYQLSQDDLTDLSSTCYAAVTALYSGQTLESYLFEHGQLQDSEPLTLVQWIKLISMMAVGLLLTGGCCCYALRVRQLKKKSAMADDDTLNGSEPNGEFDGSVTGTIHSGSVTETLMSGFTNGTQTYATGYTTGTGTMVSGTTAGTQTNDGSNVENSDDGSESSGSFTFDVANKKEEEKQPTTASQEMPRSPSTSSTWSWIQKLQQRSTPLMVPIAAPQEERKIECNFAPMFFQPPESSSNNKRSLKKRLVSMFKRTRKTEK